VRSHPWELWTVGARNYLDDAKKLAEAHKDVLEDNGGTDLRVGYSITHMHHYPNLCWVTRPPHLIIAAARHCHQLSSCPSFAQARLNFSWSLPPLLPLTSLV
jgi:hypothetical protein